MIRRIAHTLVIGCLAVSASAAPTRNVVLMVGDDHGLQLGCYGDPVVQTPALDRLAAQGTRFTQAYATVSSCSASRSVIYTGMQNHTNGQYGHAHAYHNLSSFDQVRSLPTVLGEAGYRVALVGKFHVKPPKVYPFNVLPCPGGGREVTAMAEAAAKFMAEPSDKPFLLVVGFSDPHRAETGFGNDRDYPGVKRITYDPRKVPVPSWLPDSIETRRELADYYESISRMDQGVGKILDAIENAGRAKDTLIIYVGDNGPPWPGAKTTLYDPGIHLPLLISSPAQQRRAGVCNAMISFVDITPTIYDWASATPPMEVDGRSLLPILDEENPAGWDEVFGSHTFHEITMYYPMRMIRTRRYKYILNLAHPLPFPFASDLWASPTWQGVLRRGDTTYGQRTVEAYLHHPKEELYDLVNDPAELKNLSQDSAHAEVLNDLRKRLRAWQTRTQDPWIVKYEYE